MSSKILVREFMRSPAVTFRADSSVENVVAQLIRQGVTGAPVVDDRGCVIGYVTEQDCLRQMLNDSYYSEDHDVAANIMSINTITVSPEDDILKLAQMILDQKPKSYPVIEDGELIGVITRSEILKALDQNRIANNRR